MTDPISFFVPGKAAPGGSKTLWITPQGRRNLQDAGKGNAKWKKHVTRVAKEHYHGEPLTGPLKVELVFVAERPKCHYRSGKYSHLLKDSAPVYPTGKPDALKLARAVEDACTGVIWKDDAQTVRLVTIKSYGSEPGVHIEVREVEP